MSDQPQPKPISLMPFFWSLMMISGWLLVGSMPAQQVNDQGPTVVGWTLLAGVVVSTVLVLVVDRRFGPKGFRPLWWPPAWWMVPAAIAAASGTAILASELGNVMLALSPEVIPAGSKPIAERIDPQPLAVLVGLVAPVAVSLVLHGVAQRALAAAYRPRTAVIWSVVLGSLIVPAPPFQAAALALLPVWLYRHTRSLLLCVAAWAPFAVVVGLALFDVGLGIEGFDVTSADEVLYQPIWFDLLGAALVALGIAPFIRALEGPR